MGAVSPVFSVGKSFNLNTDLFGVFTLEETDIGSELEVRGSRESKSLDHELEVFVINVVFRLHNLSFLFFITIASSNFVLVGLHVDLAINNFSTDKHVTKGHSVLGECTCLVGANARSRSEGLNRLKILESTFFLAIRSAVRARETVTVQRRPSGTLATIIPMAKTKLVM